MWSRWPSGKDKVLEVGEARFESRREHFSVGRCCSLIPPERKKGLNRIRQELKQVWSRWPSGKDKVLQVCEARFESRLCREHFSVGRCWSLIPPERRKG